jgi:hypothetical protein
MMTNSLRNLRTAMAEKLRRGSFVMPQDLIEYESWNETYEHAAHIELPFLQRFCAVDAFLTRVCRELARQIDPGLPSVLAGGQVPDYCCSYPESFLIAVPTAEANRLLGWPDLAHELAHVRYWSDRDRLIDDFLQAVVDPYFSTQAALEDVATQWRGEWLEELACDILATYELGPAYGWQHLRRTLGRSEGAYVPTLAQAARASHPADAARMRAILGALRALDVSTDAQALEDRWNGFLSARDASVPGDDARTYPEAFVQALVPRILAVAPTLRIRSAGEPVHAVVDLRALLNDAWRVFLQEPERYDAWERARIGDLASVLA